MKAKTATYVVLEQRHERSLIRCEAGKLAARSLDCSIVRSEECKPMQAAVNDLKEADIVRLVRARVEVRVVHLRCFRAVAVPLENFFRGDVGAVGEEGGIVEDEGEVLRNLYRH